MNVYEGHEVDTLHIPADDGFLIARYKDLFFLTHKEQVAINNPTIKVEINGKSFGLERINSIKFLTNRISRSPTDKIFVKYKYSEINAEFIFEYSFEAKSLNPLPFGQQYYIKEFKDRTGEEYVCLSEHRDTYSPFIYQIKEDSKLYKCLKSKGDGHTVWFNEYDPESTIESKLLPLRNATLASYNKISNSFLFFGEKKNEEHIKICYCVVKI